MTQEQRHAAISSTADLIRSVDALLARVGIIEVNTQQAEQATRVRNRLKGLRAVAFTVMSALNPDQAWFWTEEWQAKEREADADEAAGRMIFHASTEEFLTSLEARLHRADA
jgi:hypothetical protein